MSTLLFLFWHCTFTPPMRKVTGDDVFAWHTGPKPKGRGWKRAGYSDLLLLDGSLESLHEFDQDDWVDPDEITNGAFGYNGKSRHICYVGGADNDLKAMDTRTSEQMESMLVYNKYTILRHPDILIGGHYHISPKECPSFDVNLFLKSTGIPERNILTAEKLIELNQQIKGA